MFSTETVEWTGWSYISDFDVYGILEAGLPARSGVFIFTRRVEDLWAVIAIGMSDDVAEAVREHPRWGCIRQQGATHVHVLRTSDSRQREIVKDDLFRCYTPVCN